MPASATKNRRVLNVFILAMFNASIMISLRNLPLVSEFGLSLIFYFFIVALFFLVPSALVSAELASGWPKEGGVYIWVREGLGDRFGFLAIWMQWAHNLSWYPVILSFVAATMAYVISPDLAKNKLFITSIILFGFWGMTLLNYLGIKTSSWFSSLGVILGTIAPGLFIIALGLAWILSGNPIQTPISAEALVPDLSSIGNIVFLAGLFLAFGGLEVSASYAQEVQNPQKNYPRAILIAAVLTFSIFLLGSLAISFVIPKSEISLITGLIEAFYSFFSHYNIEWVLPIMGVLLIVGAVAEVNSWIIGPVKGLHATSLHGNLPPIFQKVNKHDVPTNLLLFQAIIVSITSLVFLYMPNVSSAFWILTAMSAQSYLIMYVLMFIAAIRLHYKKPHVPRAYRVPYEKRGIWIFSCMGIVASVFAILLGFVPPTQLNVGNVYVYSLILLLGLLIISAVPLIIHEFRKPDWIKKTKQ
ncbi:MAG TPA: APC family permease [Rhabdochlamydiaceae bacterium]|nr:APC family permease [Rhabdochlamydiaceae bacterium]